MARVCRDDRITLRQRRRAGRVDEAADSRVDDTIGAAAALEEELVLPVGGLRQPQLEADRIRLAVDAGTVVDRAGDLAMRRQRTRCGHLDGLRDLQAREAEIGGRDVGAVQRLRTVAAASASGQRGGADRRGKCVHARGTKPHECLLVSGSLPRAACRTH